jgi:hypothetical protein
MSGKVPPRDGGLLGRVSGRATLLRREKEETYPEAALRRQIVKFALESNHRDLWSLLRGKLEVFQDNTNQTPKFPGFAFANDLLGSVISRCLQI